MIVYNNMDLLIIESLNPTEVDTISFTQSFKVPISRVERSEDPKNHKNPKKPNYFFVKPLPLPYRLNLFEVCPE